LDPQDGTGLSSDESVPGKTALLRTANPGGGAAAGKQKEGPFALGLQIAAAIWAEGPTSTPLVAPRFGGRKLSRLGRRRRGPSQSGWTSGLAQQLLRPRDETTADSLFGSTHGGRGRCPICRPEAIAGRAGGISLGILIDTYRARSLVRKMGSLPKSRRANRLVRASLDSVLATRGTPVPRRALNPRISPGGSSASLQSAWNKIPNSATSRQRNWLVDVRRLEAVRPPGSCNGNAPRRQKSAGGQGREKAWPFWPGVALVGSRHAMRRRCYAPIGRRGAKPRLDAPKSSPNRFGRSPLAPFGISPGNADSGDIIFADGIRPRG